MEKVIITAAIIGAASRRHQNQAVPITPGEIADSAIEAFKAGASIAHIHVRDPETEDPSSDLKLFLEVVTRIKNETDMIINLSTGEGGRMVIIPDGQIDSSASKMQSAEERMEHIIKLKPEICSLDIGTMNFGPRLFVNTQAIVDKMAELIVEIGVKPEIELFDIGHIRIADRLIKKGLVQGTPHFQLCMGTAGGLEGTPKNALHFAECLPDNCTWSIFGVSHSQFPMVAMGTILGGHVRVGMEDNLYLSKGIKAKSNAELVERAVIIIQSLNHEIATTEETRALLGLNNK